MQVAAAHARSLYFEHHIAGAWRGVGEVAQLKLSVTDKHDAFHAILLNSNMTPLWRPSPLIDTRVAPVPVVEIEKIDADKRAPRSRPRSMWIFSFQHHPSLTKRDLVPLGRSAQERTG
jgi:hypothetical protein